MIGARPNLPKDPFCDIGMTPRVTLRVTPVSSHSSRMTHRPAPKRHLITSGTHPVLDIGLDMQITKGLTGTGLVLNHGGDDQ